MLALIGFFACLTVGVWLILSGFGAIFAYAAFTGQLLSPRLILPVIGTGLIYLALHFSPITITITGALQ